jgi:hypothetical protein
VSVANASPAGNESIGVPPVGWFPNTPPTCPSSSHLKAVSGARPARGALGAAAPLSTGPAGKRRKYPTVRLVLMSRPEPENVFRSVIAGPERFDRTADVLLKTKAGVVVDGMANVGVPSTVFGWASTRVSRAFELT